MRNFFVNLISRVNNFKLLWLFMMIYVIVILLANWFNPRIVEFFGISTDAGTIIFPLTFLMSDIITEVYGYKYARKSIWFGFLFSIFFFAYGFLVKESGSPAFAAEQNAMFDQVFSLNMLFIIAGFISYWIAEPMNSFIMAKLKILMKGKFMAGRFVGSTFVAAFLDSFIFSHIAFITLFSYKDLWSLLIVMWLVKVGIELIGLSFSIPLTKKIKQFEQMDRYDRKTNFSVFSTNIDYSGESNEYSKKG